jgi:hypothetical protein
MINFQNEMQNLAKFKHFEKFIFIQQWLHKTCDLLGQLYAFLIINCKIFHSKKISSKKMGKAKKCSRSFYKVILLAPIYVFAHII